MAKFVILAIALAACAIVQAQVSSNGAKDQWGWKLFARRARSTDPSIAAIRDVLRRIANGVSQPRDDDELVKLIKEEIIQTAQKIKTPALSIEAAAKRAQNLVSELTTAYTTAIYTSSSTDDARRNFLRFQGTVQKIVDFTKSGEFVA